MKRGRTKPEIQTEALNRQAQLLADAERVVQCRLLPVPWASQTPGPSGQAQRPLKPRKRRRTSAGAGSPALEKTAGLWIGLFQVPDVVYRYRSERDVVRRAQGSGFAITRCPHCCRLAEPPPLCCRSLARVHAWGHEVIQLSDMLASKLYATRSNFHELSHCQSTMKLHTPNPQMAKSS